MPITRSQLKANTQKGTSNVDFQLLILIVAMIIVGLIMISSASVVMSRTVAGKDNYYFFSQLRAALAGFVLLYLGSKIDYRFWKKVAPILLGVNIFLLLMVFVPHIGFGYNGSHRWLKIGPLFLGQPSEFIKLTMILYLSTWFENKGKDIKSFVSGTLPFVMLLGFIVVLLMLQPDLGTTTVMAAASSAIFFVAGASYVHIAGMVVAAVGALTLLIKTSSYRMARLMIFLNPGADAGGSGYHINQALLAVGSGGLFGVGFGRSRQKFNYLPEAATDSIFAVISEELGFIRTSFILLLFVLFAIRGYKIAKNAPDVYSRLIAVGITTWVVAQAFINIMAILSLIPLTGVPLPFISYGGSSLVTLMFACGILLNISKHVSVKGEDHADSSIRWWNWRSYFTGFSRNRRA